MDPRIERMQEKHIAAVVALEQACQLSSRGQAGYQKALQDRRSILLVVTHSVACGSPSEVIAIFSALMIVDELQIDNLAVGEGFRRNGLATILLGEALRISTEQGMSTAFLEVRASNFAAINLYERNGFIVAGRRKGYYQNPLDDALTMSLTLCKHT